MQYCQVESNWLSQQSVCVVTEELDNTVSASEPLHIESSNPSSAEFPFHMAARKNGIVNCLDPTTKAKRSQSENSLHRSITQHSSNVICRTSVPLVL